MNFKDTIKHRSPAPVRYVLKRVYQYWLRMKDWFSVAREVRGETFGDSVKLWASLFAGPVTSLNQLGRWQYPILLFDVNVRVLEGSRFTCKARTDQLFQVTPSAQSDVTRVLRETLAGGDTFIDAGANIGFFTVLAANLVGPTGQVLSVEMMPDTANTLRKHIALNQLNNVTVVEKALSDVAGSVLTAGQPSGSAGQASVAATRMQGVQYIERSVTTTTLDDVAATVGPVKLMKVDLEGHEEAAFKGGLAMLSRVSAVIFEYWPEDERAERAAALLRGHGFSTDRRYSYNVLAVRESSGSGSA